MEYADGGSGQNGDERDRVADQRDLAGEQRDLAEVRRDHIADRRDQDGDRRDRLADRRDRLADQRDRDANERDRSEARETANVKDAVARLAATLQNAIADRQQSRADRGAAASERTQSEHDRGAALADRQSGADARGHAEDDRDISLGDRAASQRDRHFGAQFATSLQFGWTVRSLDPPEFLYTSPGYLRIMGVRPDRADFTLAEAMSMVHPDDPDPIPGGYWTPRAGTAYQAEMRIIRPDGEIRWIRSTSNPVINPDGTMTRAAAEIEDITERKAAEAALHAAQSRAELANMAKTEFLSRVSHELRTPLNAVLGFAQLLELDPLPTPQAVAVQQILRGGRHLLQLIDDVLETSRIETNDFELSFESIPVEDLLTEAVGFMQSIATAAQIEIRYTPPVSTERGSVLADRRRLRQVLINLLSNAIKYNQCGGLVEVTDQTIDANQLRISIRDTGPGIAASDLPRLFTMFDRLGRESGDIGGSGIGLAHSRILVEAMDGQLAVDSEFGVGSTFSVVLPQTGPALSDGPGVSVLAGR